MIIIISADHNLDEVTSLDQSHSAAQYLRHLIIQAAVTQIKNLQLWTAEHEL